MCYYYYYTKEQRLTRCCRLKKLRRGEKMLVSEHAFVVLVHFAEIQLVLGQRMCVFSAELAFTPDLHANLLVCGHL